MRARLSVSLVAIGLVITLGGAQCGGNSRRGGESSPSGVLLFADYSLGGERVPGLYRIDADGTSGRPLRGRFYLGQDPDWSPDGRRIAFVRWLGSVDWRSQRVGQDIVLAAANGAAPRVLIAHTDESPWPRRPEWSPDGRRIAFVSSGQAYVTDTKPEPFKTGLPLRRHPGADWISWSPAGDELLIAGDSGIYRLPIESGPARRILRHGQSPVWSPDGRRVAYVADGGGVRVLDLRNGHSRFVTRAWPHANPEWSPDGHWLALAECRPPAPGDVGLCDLAVVRADGSGRRVIYTTSPAGIGAPSWH